VSGGASRQTGRNNGIGIATVLFIVFLVLKLTHYIDWSWWWITAPLWGPFGLFVVCVVIVGLAGLLAAGSGRRVRR
jgi:phosphoglycerol transferase MdoB-like AlkP superfamily enzyme